MTILTLLTEWLKIYWGDVLLIVAFLALCAYLLKRGKVETVKRMVYYFVVQAEKQLGSKTGPLKYAMVVAAVYDKLPRLLRFLYTQKDIDRFIDDAVQQLKEYLEKTGANLLAYSEEMKQP
jgi:hypothetical protein